jgi:tRNA threonylcarbamoyladenosine biosynthesis protein TsaB
MQYILNIETATKNCSVSLAENGQTVVCKELSEQGYSHAEKLHLFIQDVLQEAGIALSLLSAIAVSQGPGSYTGLRIGVSAAKGLSYSLQIPLIAVDTLAALAQQVSQNDGFIVPMIDARRMEVYSAIFDSNKQKIREVQAEIITAESFESISEKIYFIGDSNEKVKSEIISLMQDRDEFGYKKYSVHLKIKNGRSFYNDLLSELLDASVYAKGIIEECETFCDETQDIYFEILKLIVRLYEYQMEKNE